MGTDIKLGPGVLWEIDLPTSISIKVRIEDLKKLSKKLLIKSSYINV